jgi:F-type H+-transporting ATPase subunit b
MIELNWTILIQMVNFLILIFVLNKVLYKPVLKVLEERDEKIYGGQQKIKDLEEETRQMLKHYTEKIYKGRIDALEAKNVAKKEAVSKTNDIINEARAKAEEITQQVRSEIVQEVGKAKKEIESDLASIAASIAQRVLGREVA